jgi:ribosomal protein S6
MVILPAALNEDGVRSALQRVREEIARQGGQSQEPDVIGKRTFARPMKKQEAGHYVKLRFELDPNAIDPLLGRLKLAEDVFRLQILRNDDIAVPEEAADAGAAQGAEDEAGGEQDG